MTRIDDTRVPRTAEIQRKYEKLLRQVAQKQEGRVAPSSRMEAANSEKMKMAEACRDFEALFIQQMLTEMRRGLNEGSVLGGNGGSLSADRNRGSFFRDKMYENISKDMANQSGFGIGAVLFEQLYRQENPDILPGSSLAESFVDTSETTGSANSVVQLLEQQKQAYRQQRSMSQVQLVGRFYK